MSERIYPDDPAEAFAPPPVTFEDREERGITIRAYDGSDEEEEALVEMYEAFDPADRAQGIPPGKTERIRTWLSNILDEDCLNVVAWDGETAAGHATLVPDGDAYELAIFVLQAYQRAGIGRKLMEALLGYGREEGVEKVWLTVERWNKPAVGLYKDTGFETSDAESFELEMTIRLG
ncbi:N-acetyltransferase family protein [Salinigranum sp.]|uniref:GNAT family N-acetyltransferase n=1 Tax=Salinigranum sp. TaxID=1966351 RepID=UPI003568BF4D